MNSQVAFRVGVEDLAYMTGKESWFPEFAYQFVTQHQEQISAESLPALDRIISKIRKQQGSKRVEALSAIFAECYTKFVQLATFPGELLTHIASFDPTRKMYLTLRAVNRAMHAAVDMNWHDPNKVRASLKNHPKAKERLYNYLTVAAKDEQRCFWNGAEQIVELIDHSFTGLTRLYIGQLDLLICNTLLANLPNLQLLHLDCTHSGSLPEGFIDTLQTLPLEELCLPEIILPARDLLQIVLQCKKLQIATFKVCYSDTLVDTLLTKHRFRNYRFSVSMLKEIRGRGLECLLSNQKKDTRKLITISLSEKTGLPTFIRDLTKLYLLCSKGAVPINEQGALLSRIAASYELFFNTLALAFDEYTQDDVAALCDKLDALHISKKQDWAEIVPANPQGLHHNSQLRQLFLCPTIILDDRTHPLPELEQFLSASNPEELVILQLFGNRVGRYYWSLAVQYDSEQCAVSIDAWSWEALFTNEAKAGTLCLAKYDRLKYLTIAYDYLAFYKSDLELLNYRSSCFMSDSEGKVYKCWQLDLGAMKLAKR